jgi:hypothetical protein
MVEQKSANIVSAHQFKNNLNQKSGQWPLHEKNSQQERFK